MKNWEDLPDEMKNQAVRYYYDVLQKKKASLAGKRVFDLVMSVVLIVVLFPFMLLIGLAVKLTSPGEIVFRQTRVTTYGKRFWIYKFRTMTAGAPAQGSQVTVSNDARVTGIGRFLRKVRLDELPQLFNILKGEMSFVGTRPEVEKYVAEYSDEMYATLLLPAGVTSTASIEYKDEEKLLSEGKDVNAVYTGEILPAKMKYNLKYLEDYSFFGDIGILFRTVAAVLR
ncbi:MAG: sugar transferase [Roseburia sp.]|nr:sugar transferase [Roseburia sp.]